MKIATITFHHVYNFGGVLQALALQTFLEKMGHEVQIIDYRPKYLESEYRIWKSPIKSALQRKKELQEMSYSFFQLSKSIFRCWAGTLKQNLHISSRMCKRRAFEKFINTNLNLTKRYQENNIASFNSDMFDVYICGSDQIWNKKISGGNYDPAYFFGFLNDEARKNSYSASSGDSLSRTDAELNLYLDSFDYVSVREKKDQRILQEILHKSVYQTIDPTLLLTSDDYSKYERKNDEKGPYILVYLLERNPVFFDILKKVKKETGIEHVIDLSSTHYFFCDNLMRKTVGPDGFLSYVKNASFVLTNSFHGTVFSVIYHKQFFTFPHSQRASRMVELLEALGLQERIVGRDGKYTFEIINFAVVDQQRCALIAESEKYINNLLRK
ncbi:MAG: polysaccharide pyruvyl transferase family protein [Treponema sp.]|nr:polysaccharide pyruvyl transferase family protein [Treponema sp.]